MCFGAGASFAAGTLLSAAGAATLKESRSKKERLFAFLPVLFAAHQFVEGALWLILARPAMRGLQQGLTFVYLLVSHCFWPVLIPLSLYFLEPDAAAKKRFLPLVAFGAATGLYLFYFIVTGPFQASLINCSVQYSTSIPPIRWLAPFYVAAVIVPYFVSSYQPIRALGLINLVFYGAAYYYYADTFASVWCFFAAALSLNIYLFFRWLHHRLPAVIQPDIIKP